MRERKPGVWELRVYTGRDPVTKRPRQISRVFRGGKRDAGKALAKLTTEANEGKYGGSNATAETLLDRWLQSAKGRVTESSYATYADVVKRLKKTDLMLVRLNRVGPEDVDAAYAKLRSDGTTGHVMVQVHRYLTTAFNQGIDWGWLTVNPTKRAKRPPAIHVKPPKTSVAEVHRLIAVAEETDKDMAVVIFLAALTGLRRGELCGLKWSDVDGSVLTLRRALVCVNGRVIEKPLKARQGGEVDSVPLGELELSLLVRLRAQQEARAAEARAALPPDGWLLSYDGMGHRPRRPDAFGKQVAAAGKAAGMKTSPHKLRHFMATELLGRGVDIQTVAARLRHRNTSLTLSTYVHGDEAREAAAAEVMGTAMALPTKEAS